MYEHCELVQFASRRHRLTLESPRFFLRFAKSETVVSSGSGYMISDWAIQCLFVLSEPYAKITILSSELRLVHARPVVSFHSIS